MNQRERGIVRTSLSIGVATGAYGVSFGALATAAGLNVWQAVVLSVLMFTGGSQFAFVGVVAGGGNLGAAIATSAFLGVRNTLYGLRLTSLLGLAGWRRVAGAQLTIDESTAVAVSHTTQRHSRLGFWWTGLAVFVLWNLMTAIGAVAGNALGDPRRWGLDAAAAAAFLALLWPRLTSRRPVVVAASAAAVALVLSPLVPAGLPVLASALVAVVAGWAAPAVHGSTEATA